MLNKISPTGFEQGVGKSLERALNRSVRDCAPIPMRTAMGAVATANPGLNLSPAQLAEAVVRAAAAVGLPLTVPLAS